MIPKIYQLSEGKSLVYYEFMESIRWAKARSGERALDAMKRGEIKWKKFRGGRFADQHRFAIYQAFSSAFIGLLQENGVNNFKSHEFKIIEPSNSPRYYYLELHCKTIRRYRFVKRGLMDMGSISFDIADWGGEDLFTIEGTDTILCTEKVKQLVDKYKLKNIRFKEIKIAKEDYNYEKDGIRKGDME